MDNRTAAEGWHGKNVEGEEVMDFNGWLFVAIQALLLGSLLYKHKEAAAWKKAYKEEQDRRVSLLIQYGELKAKYYDMKG